MGIRTKLVIAFAGLLMIVAVVVMVSMDRSVAGIFSRGQVAREPSGDELIGAGRRHTGQHSHSMFRHAHLRTAALAADEDQLDARRLQQRRPGTGFGLRRDDDHPAAHRARLRINVDDGELGRTAVMR